MVLTSKDKLEYTNGGSWIIKIFKVNEIGLMIDLDRIKYLGGIKDDKSARMEDMKPFI